MGAELARVRVAHNCVLPAFRRRGYGATQLKQLATLLRAAGFTRAVAQTGAVDFFAPARAMYERSCFVRAATHPPGPLAPFRVVEYGLALRAAAPGPRPAGASTPLGAGGLHIS